MKKEHLIFLGVLLVIGVILFFDQVLALFQGMSPLEAMQKIFSFILHVVVVTILSYVAFTLPEIVKPWLRMVRRRGRAHRRGRFGRGEPTPRFTGTFSNKDRVLWWMVNQMAKRQSSKDAQPSIQQSQNKNDGIRLDF